MKVFIASLIACTLLYSASAFEWHTCAEGKADVSHVALSPDPPQAGDTISFSIDAESSKLLLPASLAQTCINYVYHSPWNIGSICCCQVLPYRVWLSLVAEIDVAQGSVAIAVAFRGLPVYSETKDLCERTTCPVQKGPLNLSYDEYLPPIVPPVSIAVSET